MSKIIDLDALVGPPLKVKLAEREYKLPADLPAPLYLKVSSFADSDLDDAELYAELYADLLELFQVHQPEITSLPIGLATMIQLIPAVYGAGAEDEGGDRPSKAGTRSSKSKRKTTRSRSSS